MRTGSDALTARLRAIDADLRAGRLREAAAMLDALAAAAPSDWRVWMRGAAFARASSNIALEIDALQRAAGLAPRHLGALLEVAKALARAGRHDDALALGERAVDLDPANLQAREVAVAIADTAGKLDAAQRHLEAARAQCPNDPSIVRALARCLARQHRHGEAELLWREVLQRVPDDVMALEWLASALIELGRRDEALAPLQRLQELAPDTPGLAFHLALARGETPTTAPLEMTRELFDDYASRFDTQLVGELKYRVPRRVAEFLRARIGAAPARIVDLGCGTGLLGVYLGRTAASLVGVDLSANMLQQAARHALYADLQQADLLEFLRRSAPGSFDYAIANDVFIYVGDLTDVIPAVFAALRSGGALIFSCESTQPGEPDLVFRPSKRYAHSLCSIENLCRAAGFVIASVETLDLRLENQVPVPGFIVVADKP